MIATLTGLNASRSFMEPLPVCPCTVTNCCLGHMPPAASALYRLVILWIFRNSIQIAHGVKHRTELAKIVFMCIKCTIASARSHAVHKKSSHATYAVTVAIVRGHPVPKPSRYQQRRLACGLLLSMPLSIDVAKGFPWFLIPKFFELIASTKFMAYIYWNNFSFFWRILLWNFHFLRFFADAKHSFRVAWAPFLRMRHKRWKKNEKFSSWLQNL